MAGTWNRESVLSSMDIAPSLLELTGISPATGTHFDGQPLAETFIGKNKDSRKDPLYFRLAPDGIRTSPQLAVRSGKWKVLCQADGSRAELYDLESDPNETKNLAANYPERVDRLKTQLLQWSRSLPAW
jgi:uncharacterized sulfatase